MKRLGAILGITVILVFGTGVAAYAADELPSCDKATLTATYNGGGNFTASSPTPCTAWLTSYIFDDDYQPVSAQDHAHPQSAYNSEPITVVETPTQYSVGVPDCGTYQADLYVGEEQNVLPQGSLGDSFVAGEVEIRTPCVPEVQPSTPPTVTPPVVNPPAPAPPVAVQPVAAVAPPVTVKAAPELLAQTGPEDTGLIITGILCFTFGITVLILKRRKVLPVN